MHSYWKNAVSMALREYKTPFYLASWRFVEAAYRKLSNIDAGIPITHWYSFKTHPIGPFVRMLRQHNHSIEVVSEYEYLAALKEGFPSNKILINGPAKHRWMKNHFIRNALVHFDSITEISELAHIANSQHWKVGLRLHTNEEFDPDEPEYGGQFGLEPNEIPKAIQILRQHNVRVHGIHFHLRSNVSSVTSFQRALEEAAQVCRQYNLKLTYIDCGGGLPVRGEKPIGRKTNFRLPLTHLQKILCRVKSFFPGISEIWLENGRFITAQSTVLVIKVWDIKSKPDSRYIICDGGRTRHALVSDWELHDIFILPPKPTPCSHRHSTICGPTCMAYDRLLRDNLPTSIEVGDYIVWMNAGAYHIPWETRFSGGLSRVLFLDQDENLHLAREEESFHRWWGQWR